MSVPCSGRGSVARPCVASRAALGAFALAAALLAGGCAQDQARTAAPDPRIVPPPYRVAADGTPQPDLEDDGREAQAPPLKRATPLSDDPNEPWSPNYGAHRATSVRADAGAVSVPGAASSLTSAYRPARLDEAAVPRDLPSDFRRRLLSAAASE